MTDAQRSACEQLKLYRLWWHIRYRSNKRKSRLYTVACCRQVWRLFADPVCRRAVEVSERYADGAADREDLIEARRRAEAGRPDPGLIPDDWVEPGTADHMRAAAIRTAFNRPDPNDVAQLVQHAAPDAADLPQRQFRLFHDLAGPNLFRPVPADRSWLTWNDGAAVKIASTMYKHRAFERMPLLGDALEDAGCADAAILHHCREPGEHARGCWVVDLLLGKR